MPTINIDELYRLIDEMQKLGVEPGEQLKSQLQEIENKIINEQILPIVANHIHPILKQIRRDLVLIVDYSPEEGVKVKTSRRRNMTGVISDTSVVVQPQNQEPIRETRSNINPRQSSSGNRRGTTLRVTFDDGSVIYERNAKETIMECIIKIGPQRVANLCNTHPGTILRRNGVHLVSKLRDNRYGHRQHSIGDGWLVFDNTSTADKKKQLKAISDALSLDLRIETIE